MSDKSVHAAASAIYEFTAPSKRARMNDLLFDYAQAVRADERERSRGGVA